MTKSLYEALENTGETMFTDEPIYKRFIELTEKQLDDLQWAKDFMKRYENGRR